MLPVYLLLLLRLSPSELSWWSRNLLLCHNDLRGGTIRLSGMNLFGGGGHADAVVQGSHGHVHTHTHTAAGDTAEAKRPARSFERTAG